MREASERSAAARGTSLHARAAGRRHRPKSSKGRTARSGSLNTTPRTLSTRQRAPALLYECLRRTPSLSPRPPVSPRARRACRWSTSLPGPSTARGPSPRRARASPGAARSPAGSRSSSRRTPVSPHTQRAKRPRRRAVRPRRGEAGSPPRHFPLAHQLLTHYGFAGPFELRPSDILIERFSAWKRLVRNLITYFEGIADIEVRSPGGQGPQVRRTRLTLCHDPHRSPTRPRSSASSAGSSRCPS